jgi:TonB family protein
MNDAPALGLAEPKPQGENWLAEPKRSEGWSRKKWLAIIAIIFAAHVAIIFAFGEKKQIVPRAVTNVPSLKLADNSGELIALDDPTLFALPHLEGFAGPAWLQSPRVQFHRQDWTEQPRWLPLPAENLGATFNQFMQTNYFASHVLDFKPEAKLSAPTLVEIALVQNSTMQIEGELVQRRLLDEITLPSLQHDDVIAPSVVQILVNEAGDVVSTVLLESSGFKDADQRSLELARAARFAPSSRMTLGKLIFNWQTVPLAATNSPVSVSSS